jgi:hypothetical protein
MLTTLLSALGCAKDMVGQFRHSSPHGDFFARAMAENHILPRLYCAEFVNLRLCSCESGCRVYPDGAPVCDAEDIKWFKHGQMLAVPLRQVCS